MKISELKSELTKALCRQIGISKATENSNNPQTKEVCLQAKSAEDAFAAVLYAISDDKTLLRLYQ